MTPAEKVFMLHVEDKFGYKVCLPLIVINNRLV